MGNELCICVLTMIQNCSFMKNKNHTVKVGFTALPGQSWCVGMCMCVCVCVCVYVYVCVGEWVGV